MNVAVDATERVEAQQNLEQRVEERTRQLQVLLDVAATANSSLDLDEMLTKTLDLSGRFDRGIAGGGKLIR